MENSDRFLTQPTVEVLEDKTKTLKEKRLAFLNNTIEYYGKDPEGRRGKEINPNSQTLQCAYKSKDGSKACGIGRFMNEENIENLKKECLFFYGIEDIFDFKANAKFLPPHLILLGEEFLTDMQLFHDNDECWDTEGLTEEGLKEVQKIVYSYRLL